MSEPKKPKPVASVLPSAARKKAQRSVHGTCTVDENGVCDECGEVWPVLGV